MKTSESIKNIAPALLIAQAQMGGAKKGASNPYFKSKYADLGAVLEASKDLLNANGIVILQPHVTNERGKFVETTLLHSSGEWISSETEIVCSKENDPQAQGSAITYARRYGLQSLLSMPAEDDDGEKAMARKPATSGLVTNSSPAKTTTAVKTVIAAGSSVTATTVANPNPSVTTKAPENVTLTAEAPKAKVSFRKPPKTTPAATAAPASNGAADDLGLS